MHRKTDIQLSINNEMFKGLKDDFDLILRHTVRNMEEKEAEEATITMKMIVGLEKEYVNSEEVLTKPTFKHDISSVMKVEAKKSGVLNDEYVLVYDPETGDYFVRNMIDPQINIGEEVYYVDGEERVGEDVLKNFSNAKEKTDGELEDMVYALEEMYKEDK